MCSSILLVLRVAFPGLLETCPPKKMLLLERNRVIYHLLLCGVRWLEG